MKKFFQLVALVICVSVISSCGYSTRSSLPSNLRTVAVPAIKNSIDYNQASSRGIYIPLLEVNVRNEIIDRYLFDGNLRIADEGNADLTLKAELVSFDRGELREEENEDVQEYRVYISVNMQLWDNHKKEVMWQENGFTGEATYFTSGPKATSEQSAINEAVTDLARRIVERTVENW